VFWSRAVPCSFRLVTNVPVTVRRWRMRPALDETLGCPIHRASLARWVGNHKSQYAGSRFSFLSVPHRPSRPTEDETGCPRSLALGDLGSHSLNASGSPRYSSFVLLNLLFCFLSVPHRLRRRTTPHPSSVLCTMGGRHKGRPRVIPVLFLFRPPALTLKLLALPYAARSRHTLAVNSTAV
jgi:hypothetical protein